MRGGPCQRFRGSTVVTGRRSVARWQPGSFALLIDAALQLLGCVDATASPQLSDEQTYGHAAGDAVLVDTVDVMRTVLREGDILARLGGDEFAVVLSQTDSAASWSTVVERLMAKTREPVRHGGQSLDRSLSIGVSAFPADGRTIDDLLVSADVALYEAKARGRDCCVRVDSEMITASRGRENLMRELEEGVARNEFIAHFQPKVDAATTQIVGFEALARWNHPDRGIVGPYEFSEAAEACNLVVQIGEQVLLEAIRAVLLLRASGLMSTISVNASFRELSMPDYAERFMETLRRHDVEPDAISVELLETVALDDANEEVSINLRRLEQFGVRIWIDDFGVGYSTVGVLQHSFIHGVKIDRRFVCTTDAGKGQKTLLNAIVQMARGLDKGCILEGVETETELRHARKVGCKIIQGYYFSKPMPMTDLVPWSLARYHRLSTGRKAA